MPKKIEHKYTDRFKWEEEYKPIKNHLDDNASEDGFMFETFGEEEMYVLRINYTEPNRVWTVLTDDFGELCIVNGWHWVNRIGYIITEKACNSGDQFSIYFPDEIKKMLRRESRERTKLKKQQGS
jgi:hypothetical protein